MFAYYERSEYSPEQRIFVIFAFIVYKKRSAFSKYLDILDALDDGKKPGPEVSGREQESRLNISKRTEASNQQNNEPVIITIKVADAVALGFKIAIGFWLFSIFIVLILLYLFSASLGTIRP